jgi:predicted esterase YcpF (UPF0227 family)
MSNKLALNNNKKVNINKTTSITKLMNKFNLKIFQPTTDIEGEEFSFSKKTFIRFINCKNLIIEIQNHNKNKIKKVLNNIYKYSNLQVIDLSGFVCYLENACE